MKKNKLIKQKLNQLAQSVRLNPNTVQDAIFELSQAQNSVKHTRRRMLPALASVCAIIIIAFISFFIIRSVNTRNNIDASYRLSSLKETSASTVDYSAVPFEFENAYLQQKIYSHDGKIAVVATKILNVTEQGTDEIVVYQDLGNGLTDFSYYQNYSEHKTDGTIYKLRNEYKNGEYYYYCYYSDSKVNYYIVIMSPNPDAANYYFKNI